MKTRILNNEFAVGQKVSISNKITGNVTYTAIIKSLCYNLDGSIRGAQILRDGFNVTHFNTLKTAF